MFIGFFISSNTNSPVIHFIVYLLFISIKLPRKIILAWTMNSIAKIKNASHLNFGGFTKISINSLIILIVTNDFLFSTTAIDIPGLFRCRISPNTVQTISTNKWYICVQSFSQYLYIISRTSY